MTRVVKALKATYLFFAGDAILLTATLLAFALAALLGKVAQAPNLVVGIIFVAVIVGGLTLTLSRELRGRPRGG
jgi:fatty acid desaturase